MATVAAPAGPIAERQPTDWATPAMRSRIAARYRAERNFRRLGAAALIPATVYARANRARVIVRKEVLDACGRFDALIAATSLNPPGLIDAVRETVASKEDMSTKVILRRIGTYPFSMANVPALAVPMGFCSKGLPLSLQIAAKPFDEAMVFRVAHAYEQATPWHMRHPDVAKSIAGFAV